MKNRDLLKEALVDAKSLQEVAISNAKKVLEENFTPYLKNVMAAKLEEMEKEENEETISEEFEMDDDNLDEELDVNSILDELEEAKDSEKDDDKETKKDDKKEDDSDSKKPAKEKKEKDDTPEDEISIDDMSEDELKSFIEEVVGDMVAAGELEPGETVEDTEKIGDDSTENDDLDFNIGDESSDEFTMDDESNEDEEINIDSLLEEYENEKENVEEEQLEEMDFAELTKIADSSGMSLDAVKALIALAGFLGIPALSATAILAKEGISKLLDKIKSKTSKGESTEVEEPTEEMMETLKTSLRETKLLNAKLFYTLGIFKQKQSLTENQKVEVLKAFDKATTIKETKLVYETLVKKLSNKKIQNSSLKEINLGRASKTISSPVRKPVINNIIDDDVVKRMQKLAGL